MPLILPGNVGSATAATGFNVANSARFDNAGDDSLTRSKGSETSLRKGTLSFWIKRAEAVGTAMWIYSNETTSSSNRAYIEVDANENFRVISSEGADTQILLVTDAEFRDFSAWTNFVVSVDTTQGTAANRVKIYINGVLETSFSTSTYPGQNADLILFKGGQTNKEHIGKLNGESPKLSAYLSEFVFVDGLQLAADQFGEFDSDSGIWRPIDVSGLTFGNEGFYLNFQTSAELGDDVSGNTNDFSETNLIATNQSTDTCTNNSATIGNLFMGLNTPTFSEGNLQSYSNATGISPIPSSMGLASGKWYVELKYAATTSNDNTGIGITMDLASGNQANSDQGGYVFSYAAANGNYFPYQGDPSGSGATYTVGDIMGIYMDLDNMKLYFSKNGTLNSSTGLTINVSNTGFYYFCVADFTGSSNYWTWQWNFGAGCPFAISTGNTDDNGYGNFEYSPNITGDSAAKKFYSCNTKNLAEFG